MTSPHAEEVRLVRMAERELRAKSAQRSPELLHTRALPCTVGRGFAKDAHAVGVEEEGSPPASRCGNRRPSCRAHTRWSEEGTPRSPPRRCHPVAEMEYHIGLCSPQWRRASAPFTPWESEKTAIRIKALSFSPAAYTPYLGVERMMDMEKLGAGCSPGGRAARSAIWPQLAQAKKAGRGDRSRRGGSEAVRSGDAARSSRRSSRRSLSTNEGKALAENSRASKTENERAGRAAQRRALQSRGDEPHRGHGASS